MRRNHQTEEGRSSLSLIGHTPKTLLRSRSLIGPFISYEAPKASLALAKRPASLTVSIRLPHRPICRPMWNQRAEGQSKSFILTGKFPLRTRDSTVRLHRAFTCGRCSRLQFHSWCVGPQRVGSSFKRHISKTGMRSS